MIGLFLGEKKLPLEILKSLKKKKIKYFIIDLSKNNKFKKNKNSFYINIGKFGEILKIIKSKKCKKVIFAGNIIKPKLSKLKLDLRGLFYIPRIVKASKLGDAAVLKALIKILSENNINVIRLNTFNPELTLKRGIYTKIKPNTLDRADISKAISILKNLNKYNHSQGAVVRNKKLIAIEGIGGTQKLLKKSKNKKYKDNGVLVKFPKKKQDLRIDLPTIGLETFKQCKLAGLRGIVVKNKQNVFLEKKKCINFANKNKMFILSK